MQYQVAGPGQPFPIQNGTRRTRTFVVAGAFAALAVFAGAAYGVFAWTHRDEARIRDAVKEFAHAVDREDAATALRLLCAEEAASAVESGISENDHGLGSRDERPVETSNIRITGDLAQARMTRPSQQPATLYLRKESGTWKLCDPERLRRPQ
ncbi:MAG: hypothetical protein ACRDOO_26995 [Actinomadura sp.]